MKSGATFLIKIAYPKLNEALSTFILVAAYAWPVVANASECRTASLPDGTPAMFCKDKSGNWKQQAGEVVVAAPSGAKSMAPLSVQASYQGTVAFTPNVTPNLRRGLDLGNILQQAVNARGQRIVVSISVAMKISGPNVTAQFTSSTGWNKVTFVGTRKNGICTLTGSYDGETDIYTGRCDESGFSGNAKAYGTNGRGGSGPFELNVISYEDTTERDGRRAELKRLCDGGKQTACVELDQK